MGTRFYLHGEAPSPTLTGTLPATNATVERTAYATPGSDNGSGTATPTLTNRGMDETISVSAQESVTLTTDNVTGTAQQQPLARWCSQPLATQTIPFQSMTGSLAALESNTNSNFAANFYLYLWRPSTGAMVVSAALVTPNPYVETTTAQVCYPYTGNFDASVDVTAGDIFIVEAWRDTNTQAMGTSYTNTIYFDGTTVDSASNTASYIEFVTTTLTFAGVETTGTVATTIDNPVLSATGTNLLAITASGGPTISKPGMSLAGTIPQDTPEIYGRMGLGGERLYEQLLAH